MQNLTRFEDDHVSAAGGNSSKLQKVLNKDIFPEVLALSADLAESMGVDIVQAAEMMGKALVAPGEGMRVLKQAGVADEQTLSKHDREAERRGKDRRGVETYP